MLKTPRFPVWLCCINGSYSVLFSLNSSLLSNWKTEHLFQLYYYSGRSSQRATARLTIGEDRSHSGPGLFRTWSDPLFVLCYRYTIPPLSSATLKARRRSREKFPFTGNDHQDQVGRVSHRLEQNHTFLLTRSGLDSPDHRTLIQNCMQQAISN